MARFFVGQRVKKVRGEYNVGLTGVITSVDNEDEIDIEVAVDASCVGTCEGIPMTFMAGEKVWWPSHLWEPILPEGAQPSEFTTLAELLNSIGTPLPA